MDVPVAGMFYKVLHVRVFVIVSGYFVIVYRHLCMSNYSPTYIYFNQKIENLELHFFKGKCFLIRLYQSSMYCFLHARSVWAFKSKY